MMERTDRMTPSTPPSYRQPAPNHPATLAEIGSKHAVQLFRMELADYRWIFGGLSGEDLQDVSVYLGFVRQTLDLLGERANSAGASETWEAARSELRAACAGSTSNAMCAALAELLRRRRIPQQLPFDLFDGVDWWIRFGRFATYAEWAHFAAQLGGSTLHALAILVGCDRPGFESAATQAGQALALTQILGRLGTPCDSQRCLLPAEVLSQCHLEPDDLLADDHGKRFAGMIRGLAARVELEFFEGTALSSYLSFDGQRVLRSLFAVHWHLLNRIKEDPLHLLQTPNRLNRLEWLSLRFHHVLGTEGKGNPWVAAMKDTHGGH